MPVNNVSSNIIKQTSQTQSSKTTETNSDAVNETSKKSLTNTHKIAIGTGLLALASVGIYLATRGRAAKQVEQFKEPLQKFVKGKAILENGENYTGNIIKESKDGSKILLEYADGVLKKSTKTKDENVIFTKVYEYSDDLGLKKVYKDGQNTFEKYIDNDKLLDIKTSKGYFSKDKQTGIMKEGSIFYHPDSKDLKGSFRHHLSFSKEGLGYKPEVKGIDMQQIKPDASPGYPQGMARLFEDFRASSKANPENVFNIQKSYNFDGSKKYTKKVDEIFGKFGEYKKLDINLRTGIVSNGDTQLFKYNLRTNEITDLKIDKKEAEEIVAFGKEQYSFYKKAFRAKNNIVEAEKASFTR